MSRTLSFPVEPVGTVHVVADGKGEQVPAQGPVEIPKGAQAFLVLDDAAPAELPFLVGVDTDVLSGARLAHVAPAAVALLARQVALQQLEVGEIDDAAVGALAELPALHVLDLTLAGEAGPGIEALAGSGLAVLQLHGDPGATVTSLARSTSLTELHFHAPSLGVELLRTLATSTHLEHLEIEVEHVLGDEDVDVLSVLVAVASGLKSLAVTTADGASGLTRGAQVALLRACEGLSLNGVDYTQAAVARMERRLLSA